MKKITLNIMQPTVISSVPTS